MILKKTDKLTLLPFLALFSLILLVTIFIMLMQFLLIYFDEYLGKDLEFWVYAQLLFYFGVNATPMAFPLATLVSSLMVFGSLGEQLALTALKTAGIQFRRIIRPLFIFGILLSLFVYYSNGYIVPKMNVKAYSLNYDLRKKKPTLAIKEGVFYNGIPNYSIRVAKKENDDKTLRDIIIYDHTKNQGNINVTTAAYGYLSSLMDGQYLCLELFDGHNYMEEIVNKKTNSAGQLIINPFYRSNFDVQKVLINLDAFKFKRTGDQYFSYHQTTKTTQALIKEITKKKKKIEVDLETMKTGIANHYHIASSSQTQEHEVIAINKQQGMIADSFAYTLAERQDKNKEAQEFNELASVPQGVVAETTVGQDLPIKDMIAEVKKHPQASLIIHKAMLQTKDLQNQLRIGIKKVDDYQISIKILVLEKHKRIAYAFGCIIMLLLGTSLGALIKKGGLGMPLIISTIFILLYYVIDMFGSKWAKVGIISAESGAWLANIVLMPFALFFLRRAQKDSRILEADAYFIWWKKLTVKK